MVCCFFKRPKIKRYCYCKNANTCRICDTNIFGNCNDKKDRIEFDLKSIIKSNDIRKVNDLRNKFEKKNIIKCNQKLSYYDIIDELQIEIDKMSKVIWDYNVNCCNTDKYTAKSYQKLIKYKIELRDHYVNLMDKKDFKENNNNKCSYISSPRLTRSTSDYQATQTNISNSKTNKKERKKKKKIWRKKKDVINNNIPNNDIISNDIISNDIISNDILNNVSLNDIRNNFILNNDIRNNNIINNILIHKYNQEKEEFFYNDDEPIFD